MKLLLTFILLFCTLLSYSQKPPKGTILIIVKNELSKQENFAKVCGTLLKNEYQISRTDTSMYLIESKRKRLLDSGFSYNFNFIVEDSAIAVYGKLMDAYMPNTLSEQVYLYIENKGMGGSIYSLSFNTMLSFTRKLGGTLYFITDIKKLTEQDKMDAKNENEDDDIYYKSPSDEKPEKKPKQSVILI